MELEMKLTALLLIAGLLLIAELLNLIAALLLIAPALAVELDELDFTTGGGSPV